MFGNTLKPLNLAQAAYSVVLLAVFFLVSLATAQAAQVTLAWSPSSTGSVTGYRVSYGATSGNYTNTTPSGSALISTTVCVGTPVKCTYQTPDLPVGTYFAVRAFDGAGNASGFSNEVMSSGVAPPPTTNNIALLASVTASSQNTATNQQAVKAVDGVADGYGGSPGDYTREWATLGQGLGAWIELNWSTAYQIDRVVLHDRPNANDQITAATLTFGDGSSVAVGALANNGAATEIRFAPRVTSRVRLAVTTVSTTTANVGLAEFVVYGASVAVGNQAPVANAGVDQPNVAEGAAVGLNGSGSSDPDGNALSYRWTQTAGQAVTLTGATTAAPSFTAPTGLTANAVLTFSLIVNDGQLDSTADTVNVTVVAANPGNRAPVANAGVDQTVAEGAAVGLNGSGSSDPNGDPLRYQWSQTAGSAVTLTGATTANPSFTAPTNLTANAVLTFSLIVNDGQLSSAADTVNITVVASAQTASNIASRATVTASSENRATNQQAVKAVDGVADGYGGSPGNYTREWATLGQKAGAWIQLDWGTAYQIDRVVLYDRPNTSDQITRATLTFSDGSTVAVGALANNGAGTEIRFAPVTTSRVRLTVTAASSSTQNIGLAEFQVYTASANGSLPSGWASMDIGIGGVMSPGSAIYNAQNNTFTLQGSGADIGGSVDAFRFAYQTLAGNGTITVRVASLTNTDSWAKAGVMIRESLDANARQAMVVVTPGNGVAFQRRLTTGGTSTMTTVASVAAPYWVRLTRTDNTFAAYRSADGSNWTLIGSATISMGNSVYVGLALTSHNNSALGTATLDNVSVVK